MITTVILFAAIPFGVLLLGLALGGSAAFFLFGRGEGPAPAPGTIVMIGTVGSLEVEARQQSHDSIEWYVRQGDKVAGSGAGTYEQAPLNAMLEHAFSLAQDSDPVTLTFPAEGAIGRAKEHLGTTIGVMRKGTVWGWSAADGKHAVFALGEAPSRGTALLKAEQAASEHQGVSLQGFGAAAPAEPPAAPASIALVYHGARVDECHLTIASADEWMAWAREQVKEAFDTEAQGIPPASEIVDATIGTVLTEAGVEGCDIEDIMVGESSALDIESKIDALLEALQAPDFLSIPGPDEMMAAILGDLPIDNEGHKGYLADWAIVVRPREGKFMWWVWKGPRMLDEDAEAHGEGETQEEAIALAEAAIASFPAEVQAEIKE